MLPLIILVIVIITAIPIVLAFKNNQYDGGLGMAQENSLGIILIAAGVGVMLIVIIVIFLCHSLIWFDRTTVYLANSMPTSSLTPPRFCASVAAWTEKRRHGQRGWRSHGGSWRRRGDWSRKARR
jgi:hypothetical protein